MAGRSRVVRRAPFPVGPGEVDLRAAAFTVGDARFIVLSVPSAPAKLPALSAAEREVHAALVRGMSNQEIAALRKTSARTVANQVASLMRKLGVGSRAEAVALLLALAPPGDEAIGR